ncbi:MAG: response regulator transcription factor [Lentisphaerae bacterium]|nr:response regulator transcription factor [Lentisphaerota bacterium]
MTRKSSKEPIRVLIVDDHPLTRIGAVYTLQATTDIVVCGELTDGALVLKTTKDLQPDVILMDIELPRHDGLSLTRTIRKHCPEVRVVILSIYPESLCGRKALYSGACGYVAKNERANKLVQVIRDVTKGTICFSEAIKNNVLRTLSHPHNNTFGSIVDILSNRERQVFTLMGQGYSTRQIAKQLCLSEKTVSTHQLRIKIKLGINTRPALLRSAVDWVSSNRPMNQNIMTEKDSSIRSG